MQSKSVPFPSKIKICIDKGITFSYPKSMKTAISIPDNIFREVEEFAKEHNYSRSKVLVMAVKELLEKHKSMSLIDAINDVYSDIEPLDEKVLRGKGKKYYSRRIIKEKY